MGNQSQPAGSQQLANQGSPFAQLQALQSQQPLGPQVGQQNILPPAAPPPVAATGAPTGPGPMLPALQGSGSMQDIIAGMQPRGPAGINPAGLLQALAVQQLNRPQQPTGSQVIAPMQPTNPWLAARESRPVLPGVVDPSVGQFNGMGGTAPPTGGGYGGGGGGGPKLSWDGRILPF